mmetsp:Transcript_50704/g.121106  ORF Transcript_50704/g.121106 Transcript_50704/m.121106 type:complete len:214 (-) Transcript_50704:985-1626(-)
MEMTSSQKARCTGRLPVNKPPCMMQSPRQKMAMELALVARLKALQAHTSSSLALGLTLLSTHRTPLASSHRDVSSMSGVFGVSLIQTKPCSSSVTERTPAHKSARVCAGSTPYLDASENTKDWRFRISTPRPIIPTSVGAMRICVSNLAKGSRTASSLSSNGRGRPSSKQTSCMDSPGLSPFRSKPSLAAAFATHIRSASLSKARGCADHSTR